MIKSSASVVDQSLCMMSRATSRCETPCGASLERLYPQYRGRHAGGACIDQLGLKRNTPQIFVN